MSIHVCKCGDEWHLRYPGLSEKEVQSIADRINAGAFYDAEKLEAMKQRAEAAEARIKASQEQEPVAETGWIGTIHRWFNTKIPGGTMLYTQPTIQPDIAELTLKLAEQQAYISRLCGTIDKCHIALIDQDSRSIKAAISSIPDPYPVHSTTELQRQLEEAKRVPECYGNEFSDHNHCDNCSQRFGCKEASAHTTDQPKE